MGVPGSATHAGTEHALCKLHVGENSGISRRKTKHREFRVFQKCGVLYPKSAVIYPRRLPSVERSRNYTSRADNIMFLEFLPMGSRATSKRNTPGSPWKCPAT